MPPTPLQNVTLRRPPQPADHRRGPAQNQRPVCGAGMGALERPPASTQPPCAPVAGNRRRRPAQPRNAANRAEPSSQGPKSAAARTARADAAGPRKFGQTSPGNMRRKSRTATVDARGMVISTPVTKITRWTLVGTSVLTRWTGGVMPLQVRQQHGQCRPHPLRANPGRRFLQMDQHVPGFHAKGSYERTAMMACASCFILSPRLG